MITGVKTGNIKLSYKYDWKFKFYYFFVFLYIIFTSISCSRPGNVSNLGCEIIEQNTSFLIDELYWSAFEKNENITVQIFVQNYVSDNKIFLEECNCYDIFNKEGFNIDSNTKYNHFFISKIPSKFGNKNLKLVTSNFKTKDEKYVEIHFNNFFVNDDVNRAFLIVEKMGHGIKSWTKEVYFFKKQKDKWKSYKRELLLIG